MADDGDAMTSLSVPGKPADKVPLIILRVHPHSGEAFRALLGATPRGRYM